MVNKLGPKWLIGKKERLLLGEIELVPIHFRISEIPIAHCGKGHNVGKFQILTVQKNHQFSQDHQDSPKQKS